MALLQSKESEFNQQFSHFELETPDHRLISSKDIIGNHGLLVIFTCNHCPYAKALWNRLIKDTDKIRSLGFNIVAINPNINPDYESDSPENMMRLIDELKVPFDYLVDKDQSVSMAYDAQCTPDFYLLNQDMGLIYRGAYDDNWKDETQVKINFILESMSHYAMNNTVLFNNVTPSLGCSIKWIEKN